MSDSRNTSPDLFAPSHISNTPTPPPPSAAAIPPRRRHRAAITLSRNTSPDLFAPSHTSNTPSPSPVEAAILPHQLQVIISDSPNISPDPIIAGVNICVPPPLLPPHPASTSLSSPSMQQETLTSRSQYRYLMLRDIAVSHAPSRRSARTAASVVHPRTNQLHDTPLRRPSDSTVTRTLRAYRHPRSRTREQFLHDPAKHVFRHAQVQPAPASQTPHPVSSDSEVIHGPRRRSRISDSPTSSDFEVIHGPRRRSRISDSPALLS